jgi:hypothetical protein
VSSFDTRPVVPAVCRQKRRNVIALQRIHRVFIGHGPVSDGDLAGQPTVTIITGLGAGGRSSKVLQRNVRDANGSLVKSLILYRMRPNDEDNYSDGKQNQALAVEMAKQGARGLAPLKE